MSVATPPRLGGMVAVSKNSKVKPLGYIVWFSVPDENIPLRKLRNTWGVAGLEMSILPKDQRAINVFKRAVRDQEGRHTLPNGNIVETDVRDVVETAEDVVYQISQVVRDENERLVDYPKALRVWFSKVTEELHFKTLAEVPKREVMPIVHAIEEAVDQNAKTVTGAKVRGLVRSYIKDDTDEQSGMVGLSGENLRGKAGGVYFVLAKYGEQLEQLADALDRLYSPHGRAYLYSVPLADGASERELIRRHHVTNSVTEMKDAMSEAAALLREGRQREVRENVIKHHWRKLERMKRRAGQYADALKEEQDELDTSMQMLHRQLRKLGSL